MRLPHASLLLCSILLMAAAAPAAASPGRLHVPSPDWRDQVIYFVLTDRFDDGDPRNNDQHAGEFDPADNRHYSGGDLKGVQRRLDYIRDLGATAVWITPPVANQWWSPRVRYGGYHGYWASDFARVDAHLGTLADLQALSRALHGRGMWLVQDIVINHVGDWMQYDATWSPDDPARGFWRQRDTQGRSAPVQWPFSMNDAGNPAHRRAGIYHWTPESRDLGERQQALTFQLAGLDDLNTENPVVRRALRKAYGDWIRKAGVDAFRIDTAFYVPPEFFDDFLHANDAAAPGIAHVAASTGRRGFLSFGEGFAIDKPFADAGARKVDSYMRTARGLRSMINFPLYGTLGDVFARGVPSAALAHRIESMMSLHADPWRMPTFVDNHDVDRFLAGGQQAGLKQALLTMLTLPGIPVIYYGTEQGFTQQRAAMFAGGVGSGGVDHFDAASPMYRWLQGAIALRRAQRTLSRGTPRMLSANAARPGAVAWRMDGDDASVLIALNNADTPSLLHDLALPAGTRLRPLFAIDGQAPALTFSPGVGLVMPARGGYVWAIEPGTAHATRTPAAGMGIDAVADMPVTGEVQLQGHAPAHAALQLVVDGDIASAIHLRANANGRWQTRIATANMLDAAVAHRAVLRDPDNGAVSSTATFRVQRQWTQALALDDPAGDDTGPNGRYVYPDDPVWRGKRPGDLRGVTVWTSGGALKLQLRMAHVSTVWNPTNGFDHVSFDVFVELPNRDEGARAMPMQFASLPDGMRWHTHLRLHGWSNAAYAASGADAHHEGHALPVAARIEADSTSNTITLTIPASALGDPASLRDARLYITTWDFDAGYRPLQPQAAAHAFGGGDADAPRVLDSIGPIILP